MDGLIVTGMKRVAKERYRGIARKCCESSVKDGDKFEAGLNVRKLKGKISICIISRRYVAKDPAVITKLSWE